MQRCACIVNWRDNKRLQTLWSVTGVDAWRQWEQTQEGWPGAIKSRYSSFSCQLGGNTALSSLSDVWYPRVVSWDLGQTKERLPHEEITERQHVLGLRGETTGKLNKRERHAGKQKNSLGECALLYAPALAVIQQFVSIWSLAGRKCLLIAWNKPKVSVWAKKMGRWIAEIKRPCD